MVPRPVFPGVFYFLTRSTTQGQFLLRPDEEMNNAFTYCLAEASQRFQIAVIMTCVMSNHHHTVVYDAHGRINEFTEHLHKFTAKCINAQRGHWQNMWASEPVCKVECIEAHDVLAKVVYTATNPVKDFLVDTVAHWPGVNGLYALLNDRPIRATRPRHFFSATGTMPAEVILRFCIPEGLGNAESFRTVLRERVEKIEKHFAKRRARSGRRVLGRQRILRQSWRESPASEKPRRGLRPKIAARNIWARLEAHRRDREFLTAYAKARVAWLAGLPAIFPPGTYWLRRFARVTVASVPC